MTDQRTRIDAFLADSPHAVVGASADRSKYGNKVLRCYLQNGRPVLPVNPKGVQVEGLKAATDLATLPEPVHGISVITPPAVTEQVVAQAIEADIKHIWLQPGAESEGAIARAQEAGIDVIHGGPCILVELGFRESD